MNERTVAVIGGGAAGMMAAVTAARAGSRVTIFEGNERLGKKILATGNGKCNISNRELVPENYQSGDFRLVEQCFEQFGVDETIDFFNSLGLMLKEKNGGLYPLCEQASAVLDVFRHELSALGVHIEAGIKITALSGKGGRKAQSGQPRLKITDGSREWRFDRVILAVGGKAAPKTGSDGSGYELAKGIGHHLTPIVPALVQLCCSDSYCKSLAGVRAEGCIGIEGRPLWENEMGEIQFTDYGLSGIPVFQLSRVVNRLLRLNGEVKVWIDFFPGFPETEFRKLAESRKQLLKGRTVEEYFTGMLHKKLMRVMIRQAGLKPGQPVEQVDTEQLEKVFALLKKLPFHVIGNKSFEHAQVCVGGVAMSEVSDELESRKLPGVYLAGELLDVDGRCGGYNLQWAWTSGYIAGCGAAGIQPAKIRPQADRG